MGDMNNINEMTNNIILLINIHKSDVPVGHSLLKQKRLQNMNEMLSFLLELFSEEEKMILKERSRSYVTDDYENGVRRFAVALMEKLIPYHNELKNNENYEALCRKRHIGYAFYKIKKTENNPELVFLDSNYTKKLYLSLVDFYGNFYGSFADNEEAIELLCKFYPKEIESEIKKYSQEVSKALYGHISNAGTPNDLGYAYRGIELIGKHIGNLPISLVEMLLNEYLLYYIINNKVYRHQVFAIIDNAKFSADEKKMLKFRCLDSVLITNSLERLLHEKMKKNGDEVEVSAGFYDYKLFDEEMMVFDKPHTYWSSSPENNRIMYIDGNAAIRISLQDDELVIYDIIENRSLFLQYDYTDWLLEKYTSVEHRNKLHNFILETNEISLGPMLFSWAYLDNYRGLQNQIIDFDHKFVYEKEKERLIRNTDITNKIPHIYGKSVYSLSCIVGKNGTGKTSIVDFLRETFFKLLKLIEDHKIVCENGYVCANECNEHEILDNGANFFVVFFFGEKAYFLTNMREIKIVEVEPFHKGVFRNAGEMSKIAYFSNQLRGGQEELWLDLPKKVLYDEEKRKKQELSKAYKEFRQVDYSETESCIRKRRAIEAAKNQKDNVGIVNKDICYQLSFLKNSAMEDICEYIDVEPKKELEFKSNMYNGEEMRTSLEKIINNSEVLKKAEEFVKLPDATIGHFSAGQYFKFSLLAKLKWFLDGDIEEINHYNEKIENNVFSNEEVLLDGETALIFIDEGEIYYHPEWQREFIYSLLNMVNSKPIKVQIVITTNSPFIISDILKDDIIYLTRDEQGTEKRKEECTLGQNIHKLLTDNFFLKYTIGEYSRKLIENVMLCLQTVEAEPEKQDVQAPTMDFVKSKMHEYFDEIENYYDAFALLIEQIGEPIYKYNLKKMLEESIFAKEKNKNIELRIRQLEDEKRKLQDEIDKLKEINQID